MGKIITVASGKGGTGKTTVVAALSSCLAVLGHKTLCIDFDEQLKNLDLALCMTDFAVMDFMDVIKEQNDLMTACSESPMIQNLFFLSAPAISIPEETDPAAFKDMFAKIRKNFDYCLIDCPAGIGRGFQLAHTSVDMSIIVTTGDSLSIRDANRAADAIRDMGVENIRLIVNRLKPKNIKKIRINLDDVIDTIGAQLLGLIPEDNNIFLALHENTPLILYKKRLSAYDFLDTARRIAGDEVPLQQYKR